MLVDIKVLFLLVFRWIGSQGIFLGDVLVLTVTIIRACSRTSTTAKHEKDVAKRTSRLAITANRLLGAALYPQCHREL